jgi:hypothetical protein
MRAGLVSLASMIPHYIVYAMALGATTYALSEVYLGRATTIRSAYQVVSSYLWRLLKVIFAILFRTFGIFMLAMFLLIIMMGGMVGMPKSMAWVTILVGLIGVLSFILVAILAVIFLVRYSVAVPALMLEGLSTRQALKRSVTLTKGYLWRLLVVAVLMTLISATLVSLCQMPFTVAATLMMFKGARPGLWLTIPSLLVGGLGAAATAPLLMISFALAYYDLRVRKEGFDLQLMMSRFDESPLKGAARTGQFQERLEDASVLGMVLMTFLTGGIYQPIWFWSRRRALNNLRSQEKLGLLPLSAALALLLANFLLPILGSIKWGSWVEAENTLGPIHPAILGIAGVILIVQCFKVRRILVDHLVSREEGMFSASIRIQFEEMFSRIWTFFFGIFYLQHKINGLLDRFIPDEGGEAKMELPVPQPSPVPPVVL